MCTESVNIFDRVRRSIVIILPRQNNYLGEFMESYEGYNPLAINWSIYGTNGHIRRPSDQIHHLLRRSEQQWEPNGFVKSIVRPEHVVVDSLYDVHHFTTSPSITVNENHEQVTWMTHAISTEKIRLNHYVLRSWQDYWEVKVHRQRFNNASPCDQKYFSFHDRNEVFDDEILQRFGHLIHFS